jgi:hypothetical protein
MAFFAEGLAAISAGLKAIELWEKIGPSSDPLQTLEINYNPAEFAQAEATLDPNLADLYEGVFKGTKERVANCIRMMTDPSKAGDDLLPAEREKLGRQGRVCVCREIAIIEDFLAGEIPDELKELWARHKCAEVRSQQAARASANGD